MEKLYYTISETAEVLGTSVSLVRFWSNSFPKFINPARNAKGNRLFTAKDLDTLRQIQYLVKVKGLTLDGAARQLGAERSKVDTKVRALESLKSIREQLVDIRKSL